MVVVCMCAEVQYRGPILIDTLDRCDKCTV